MIAVYAIVLVAGVVALLVWVARAALGDTVAGWRHVDPERRYGSTGRWLVAGSVGFGLGGLSATFAGWHVVLALGAAVAGAAFVVAVAARYGPIGDEPGEAA